MKVFNTRKKAWICFFFVHNKAYKKGTKKKKKVFNYDNC